MKVQPTSTSLVNSNPTGSDGKAQGDDHLRLIKAVLQNSFPNLTGPMTMTQAQLNVLANPGILNVPGMVSLWWGTEATIPTGWKSCNGVGTISTGANVPDLRDRFVVGAGTTYALGATGGSLTHTHTVTTTVDNHVLTLAEIPAHTHASNAGTGGVNTLAGGGVPAPIAGSATGSAGGGGGHNHTASSTINTGANLPPYLSMFTSLKTKVAL